jgi:carbonic anhydrase
MLSLPQALPNVKASIVGCADCVWIRLMSSELNPGEAVVMRNIGGRITPLLGVTPHQYRASFGHTRVR